MILKIVTRTSPLALWQAEYVKQQLIDTHPQLEVEIVGLKTTGDQFLNVPLHKIGGKGVFVKELEEALLSKAGDIAVHSLKDVPAHFPKRLMLGAICQRENPFDAWICPKGYTLESLPRHSRVGTSSLRRMTQLKQFRPDLEYVPLRGNVDTRLRKCQSGEWDAIVLAAAGLLRLNLQSHITTIFSIEALLPAVGQGALGLECRIDDISTQRLIAPLNHYPSRICVEAERVMNAKLGGNCQIPVAGYARILAGKMVLTGRVGHPQRAGLLEASRSGPIELPESLGEQVADDLVQQGAADIINEILSNG